jgi:hypothetical protein
MLLRKGDLVRGMKPWNEGTILGIVLREKRVSSLAKVRSFQVHWINSPENKMTQKPSFITWEVATSLEKIQNEQ